MTNTTSPLSQLDTVLETYLVKKAPGLPANVKELIVKYGPYISLILIILALPAMLLALGIGTIGLPLSFLGGVSAGTRFSVGYLFTIGVVILEIIALPGLFKRALAGWKFMYYSALLGAVQNIVTFNLGGLVIGTLLSLYILFQIKSYYK